MIEKISNPRAAKNEGNSMKKFMCLMVFCAGLAVAGSAAATTSGNNVCKTSRVGTIVNWPQTKVVMVKRKVLGIKMKVPKLMRRTKKIGLHATICSSAGNPGALIKRAKSEANSCLNLSVKAGGATLIAGGKGAIPVFMTTLKGCLATKLKHLKELVNVKTFTQSTKGHWKGV